MVDKRDFLKNIDLSVQFNVSYIAEIKLILVFHSKEKRITSHFNLNLILCYLFFMLKNLLLPSKKRWSTDKISVIPLRRVSCHSKGSQLRKSKFTVFLFIKEPNLFSYNTFSNYDKQRLVKFSYDLRQAIHIKKWAINKGLKKLETTTLVLPAYNI